MDARNQFTFYRSYLDVVENLPVDEKLDMLLAVIRFGLFGEEPEELSASSVPVFIALRPNLLAGRKKAQKAVEKKVEKENKKKNKIKKETKDDSPKELGVGFEIFWENYPVKIAREKARQVWEQMMPSLEEVLEGLGRWKNSRQWDKENGKYIPRAWRFLQDKAYLEQPPEKVPAGATGGLGQAELEAIAQVMAMDN